MERKTDSIKQMASIEFFCEKNPYGHGVQKINKKFVAIIQKDKKRFNLGSFKTFKEAQRAYNEKAIELYGDKAKLNLIDGDTINVN
jgi:hypothetical protein